MTRKDQDLIFHQEFVWVDVRTDLKRPRYKQVPINNDPGHTKPKAKKENVT
jgi:hypothetical protein